jgi:thymidylate synthase
MLTISGRNVNDVFPIGLMYLREKGIARPSRNGPTLEIMEPVSVTYRNSEERTLFDKQRDSNPFFSLFESLWMLAGRNDVAVLDEYNKGMKQYSDDGEGFNAAYGQRLRSGFGFDQIDTVIKRLRVNPDDRRAVLQIWDPNDLNKDSRDYACNLVITPRIRRGRLDWTVFNRSNDYVFGMTGANVVHLSVIQEYMARMIGVEPGMYTQITNCLHAYTDNNVWQRVKDLPLNVLDPYTVGTVKPFPLVTKIHDWDNDLRRWMECPWADNQYVDPFFNQVAKPMAVAHRAHKESKDGLKYVGKIEAVDWRIACTEWLGRREANEGG